MDRTRRCRINIRELSQKHPRDRYQKSYLQNLAKRLSSELTADEINISLTKEERKRLWSDLHYVCRYKRELEPNTFSSQEIATMNQILYVLDTHFNKARDIVAPTRLNFFGIKYLLPRLLETLNREDVLWQIPSIPVSVESAKQELIWDKIIELAFVGTSCNDKVEVL
jgi:hypothetical protein